MSNLESLVFIDQTIYANEDNSPDVEWSNAEVLDLLRDVRLLIVADVEPELDMSPNDATTLHTFTSAQLDQIRADAAADALEASANHFATPYVTWTSGGQTTVYVNAEDARTGVGERLELAAWLRARAAEIRKDRQRMSSTDPRD